MDFEKVLNEPQTEAVTHVDGPLLILAGAGSGKTRVLTHRIAYLIQEKGVHPWNILAITFTNKAAAEMKSRVEKMLGEQSVNIWVSTFHSCCARILRSEIDRYGYNRNFTIYDADDSESLIKKCLQELNINEKQYAPRMVKEVISRAKNELRAPEEFLRLNAGDFHSSKIAQVYTLYQAKLKISNAVDFDDIIMLTVNLFADFPDVLQKYSSRFKYVMVDEYQDTNTAQYMLIRALCSYYGNLCVVGDDDQSIYGWRGANIRNILDFETDFPNCKVIKLEQNYRSTKNILDVANTVIAHNKCRKSKTLFTSNDEGRKVISYTAENEHEEASFIAARIRALMRTGEYAYSDFAVLYRINALSRILEKRIIGEGIPYRIYGGFRFFERKEVKDVLAYLRLIYNPDDNVSFLRAVNSPRRGVGNVSIEKIAAVAGSEKCSLLRAIRERIESAGVGAHMVMVLKQFAEMIFDCVAEKDQMELPDFIKYVIGKSGILEALNSENTEESNERAKNVLELLSIAVEYEKEEDFGEDRDKLEGYLERATLDTGTGGQDEMGESVTLMTMHSAKGLEYKVVFIAGMEDGIFPSIRSKTEPDKLEEERRLCYVGITRAKKELYLLNARGRTLYGSTSYSKPSQFIGEIPDEFLENANERGKKPAVKRTLNPVGTTASATFPSFGRNPEEILNKIAWKKDDTVEHAKFGCGIITEAVREADDFKLTIEFESFGMKRIMASFARLKKLN